MTSVIRYCTYLERGEYSPSLELAFRLSEELRLAERTKDGGEIG